MNIDFPQTSQIPKLRHLWKEAFGDSDEFLNLFFKTAFNCKRCRCVTENGNILSVLYWFECEYMGKPIAYLYGVATAKPNRGQGICKKLLEDTHLYLKKQHYEGVILVPGGRKLFDFYQKMGYQPCSTIREFTCTAKQEELPLYPIEKEEYARLRKLLLPKNSVVQEKENLDFLQTQADFYMGKNILLAAHIENETLYGLELLGDTSFAPAILSALGCKKGSFRTPGNEKAFTMYYPLTNNIQLFPQYFCFAFD